MSNDETNKEDFFKILGKFIHENGITIDRPKGSVHPRFSDFIYPLDYGYINGTQSQDGSGIDIFRGDDPNVGIVGVICTVDPRKKDSEVKVLYQCTEENIQTALRVMNNVLRGILIRR